MSLHISLARKNRFTAVPANKTETPVDAPNLADCQILGGVNPGA
jgi:hypothetical protein